MLRRVLAESLRLEMTWRLALSALVGTATIAAGTVTYAYSHGNEVLQQSQHQTEILLRNYIPYEVFMQKWDDKLRLDQQNHQELVERLIRLEEKVGTNKERGRGHH
jgi:hypothetical protein